MSRHKELFNLMHMLDLDEIPYAIATVIKVFGSSSGKVGDKALFDQNGKRLEGYIGGGCIENRVSETAKETLINGKPLIIEIDLDSDEMGMGIPCGGFMSVLIEPQILNKTIFIKGMGALAETLCKMASLLKFKVVVQTSKSEQTRYPNADKVIIENFDIEDINLSIDYFILATHHRDDDKVSFDALKIGIPYVGVVSSKKKTEIILDYLIKNNLNKKCLNNFFSPIGLDLNAKTPEQIALSILSEIVMLENNGTGMQKRDIIKKND
jgi:xanthine dehydrogenase accessory factor